MSYSLDVNLLLYSSDSSSPLHAEARSFLQSCMTGPDILYLGWSTIMSYLRISTHPSIFDEPLTPEEAMANVETLLNLPHSRCLAEEDWILGNLAHHLPARQPVEIRYLHAHLAAASSVPRGAQWIYTHDRDLRRFDFLDVQDPVPLTRVPGGRPVWRPATCA